MTVHYLWQYSGSAAGAFDFPAEAQDCFPGALGSVDLPADGALLAQVAPIAPAALLDNRRHRPRSLTLYVAARPEPS